MVTASIARCGAVARGRAGVGVDAAGAAVVRRAGCAARRVGETVRLRRTERGFAVIGSPAAVALFYWRQLCLLRIVSPMTIGVLGLARIELAPCVSIHASALGGTLITRLMRVYGVSSARLAQRTGVSTVYIRQIRRDGVSGNSNVRSWMSAVTESPATLAPDR